MEEMSRYLRDPAFVVFEATSARDVLRIRREVEGRRWAAGHGIPTAETVAKDPADRWLVTRLIRDEAGEPPTYVAAAMEMAQRIQRLPPPRFASRGSTWRAPRRSLPVRVGRLLRAGIDLRTFAAVRRAYARLPCDATLHNDYHRDNVLNSTGELGHVTVIDWEFTAIGPRYQDMVRMIVDLRDAAAARDAWDRLVGSVPLADRHSLATQLRWLALRTYGTEVTVPPGVVDPAKCERRRARWLDAQEWARELAPVGPGPRRTDD